MDYRQLALFVAIAERLNVGAAAEAMGITQPGLSKSMHRLQFELGAALYIRRGRGIELTDAGRALLKHGKLIESQFVEAAQEVAGIASGVLGNVRIGAGPLSLTSLLPDALAKIVTSHPKLRFSVRAGYADQLLPELRSGALDVVLGALPENLVDPDLRFTRLRRDVLHVIGRKNHPLTAKRSRSLSDFAAQQWILPGRNELLRQRLIQLFRSHGLREPATMIETDSPSMIHSMLLITDCLGLSTKQSILSHPGLIAIEHEEIRFSRDAGFATNSRVSGSPALKVLIRELRRVAARSAERSN